MPRKGDTISLTLQEIRIFEQYAHDVHKSNRDAGINDAKQSMSKSIDLDIWGFLGEYAAHKLFCIPYIRLLTPGYTTKGDMFVVDTWYDIKAPEPPSFGKFMNIHRNKERSTSLGFMCMDRKGDSDTWIYRGRIEKSAALCQEHRVANINGPGYYYRVPQGKLI